MMAEADLQVLITVPFPDAMLERIRAVSPRLKLHLHTGRPLADASDSLLQEIDILYTARELPEPGQVPELRWIQFHFAGLDHAEDHPLLHLDEIQVTTLSGAAITQMAEFTVMSMLALGRKLLLMLEDKRTETWADNRFERFTGIELSDSMVGIVGYGSIGREVARLCRAFGAEVLAVKRDLMKLDLERYQEDGLGDPDADLVQRLYPPEAIGSMVAACDFVVICLPLTQATRGMIGAKVISKMKPSAYLIDISRGGVVDHGALIEALQEQSIAGASLDVYPVEPLPKSSPLWQMPNVILSPHVAGASEHYYERAADLFAANLRRFLAEQPLLNLYDSERGY